MVNNDDALFESLFGDIFDKPPTAEEIERRKREQEEIKRRVIDANKQFDAYAMTLPGSEKVREDNPIVQIESGIDKDGNFFERAVTNEEFVDEMIDDLFKGVFDDQESEIKHRQK